MAENTKTKRITSITNITTLRNSLLEDLEAFRDEQRSASDIKAGAFAAGKILQTVSMQLQYQKMTGERDPITFMVEGMQ